MHANSMPKAAAKIVDKNPRRHGQGSAVPTTGGPADVQPTSASGVADPDTNEDDDADDEETQAEDTAANAANTLENAAEEDAPGEDAPEEDHNESDQDHTSVHEGVSGAKETKEEQIRRLREKIHRLEADDDEEVPETESDTSEPEETEEEETHNARRLKDKTRAALASRSTTKKKKTTTAAAPHPQPNHQHHSSSPNNNNNNRTYDPSLIPSKRYRGYTNGDDGYWSVEFCLGVRKTPTLYGTTTTTTTTNATSTSDFEVLLLFTGRDRWPRPYWLPLDWNEPNHDIAYFFHTHRAVKPRPYRFPRDYDRRGVSDVPSDEWREEWEEARDAAEENYPHLFDYTRPRSTCPSGDEGEEDEDEEGDGEGDGE
ncbi:hypothetical protein DIS24_g12392, partial [Lasiodiplodia hormozganensis]